MQNSVLAILLAVAKESTVLLHEYIVSTFLTLSRISG